MIAFLAVRVAQQATLVLARLACLATDRHEKCNNILPPVGGQDIRAKEAPGPGN